MVGQLLLVGQRCVPIALLKIRILEGIAMYVACRLDD